MYCKNCGAQIDPGAAVCVKCGYKNGDGNRFCHHCGQELTEGAKVCLQCGFAQEPAQPTAAPADQKSKIAAGLLGIFLGVWGVHNFYLGYTKKAIVQVLLGTVGTVLCGVGPAVSSVWGLVEGIMILVDKINTDANGTPLGE
ncbi:MAG: zinc-ribbon domain-containing protein [Clostridia bacterium]|nr:zinc-ribbon domain-containing protein [Clostridia bacterium]